MFPKQGDEGAECSSEVQCGVFAGRQVGSGTFPHHGTPWWYEGHKVSSSSRPWGSPQSLCCVRLDKGLQGEGLPALFLLSVHLLEFAVLRDSLAFKRG